MLVWHSRLGCGLRFPPFFFVSFVVSGLAVVVALADC